MFGEMFMFKFMFVKVEKLEIWKVMLVFKVEDMINMVVW